MDWFRTICLEMRQPSADSTPHIYISILGLWKPKSHISQIWRPRFPHLPIVTIDGQRIPTGIRECRPQDSKGDADVPLRRVDRSTGWVLSEDGCRIIRLPHMLKKNAPLIQLFWDKMILSEPDQIYFDLQYLGPNWAKIYDPLSSQ